MFLDNLEVLVNLYHLDHLVDLDYLLDDLLYHHTLLGLLIL